MKVCIGFVADGGATRVCVEMNEGQFVDLYQKVFGVKAYLDASKEKADLDDSDFRFMQLLETFGVGDIQVTDIIIK